MRVRVDADLCQGHGMCAALAPEVYRVNEESGFNQMGEFEAPDDAHVAVERGAAACPEQAIALLVNREAGQ
ncbi:ferredoxin [Micromonospora sp. NPDC023888]|uniref:ferredoxin n=1 Tax=Micromonospora sp. NPDC023888 TaxID=3155607 RepID=UPI0033E96856